MGAKDNEITPNSREKETMGLYIFLNKCFIKQTNTARVPSQSLIIRQLAERMELQDDPIVMHSPSVN